MAQGTAGNRSGLKGGDEMKNTTTLSVSLPPETIIALTKAIEESGKSRSLLVNEAIRQYLEVK